MPALNKGIGGAKAYDHRVVELKLFCVPADVLAQTNTKSEGDLCLQENPLNEDNYNLLQHHQ